MKIISQVIGISVILTCFLTNVIGQERFVRPTDDAKKDPSLVMFRDKLIAAVKARNKTDVLRHIDKNISLSFGGDAGLKDFERIWKLDDQDSPFWDEFLKVITNGGVFYKETESSGTFCAPYSFNTFPDDIDSFEYSVVFGENVNLRSKPNLFAPITDKLSYNIIKPDFDNSADDGKIQNNYVWIKVTTMGGKTGFISAEYVRSPIDYRACFEKKGGVWKITAFIAGD